ncbi:hypothetical protein M8C21_015931 [Ambrosia artemisiifolia]|uniref:Uncharacterized protein n=1 Tax=Ambrosia artemisiifolia TaxID=4212 RepID=A0AAD5CQK3_AMBAR|nr:hypothetical protein M8C21_015931 [Ambrosia artemisiifolia]
MISMENSSILFQEKRLLLKEIKMMLMGGSGLSNKTL